MMLSYEVCRSLAVSPDAPGRSLGSSHTSSEAQCYWRRTWERLNLMRDSWQLCDISLQTEDGSLFRAHSAVLAASSELFHAHFLFRSSPNIVQIKSNILMLAGISGDVVKVTVDFMYGILPVGDTNIDLLLQGARTFEVPGANAFCAHHHKQREAQPRLCTLNSATSDSVTNTHHHQQREAQPRLCTLNSATSDSLTDTHHHQQRELQPSMCIKNTVTSNTHSSLIGPSSNKCYSVPTDKPLNSAISMVHSGDYSGCDTMPSDSPKSYLTLTSPVLQSHNNNDQCQTELNGDRHQTQLIDDHCQAEINNDHRQAEINKDRHQTELNQTESQITHRSCRLNLSDDSSGDGQLVTHATNLIKAEAGSDTNDDKSHFDSNPLVPCRRRTSLPRETKEKPEESEGPKKNNCTQPVLKVPHGHNEFILDLSLTDLTSSMRCPHLSAIRGTDDSPTTDQSPEVPTSHSPGGSTKQSHGGSSGQSRDESFSTPSGDQRSTKHQASRVLQTPPASSNNMMSCPFSKVPQQTKRQENSGVDIDVENQGVWSDKIRQPAADDISPDPSQDSVLGRCVFSSDSDHSQDLYIDDSQEQDMDSSAVEENKERPAHVQISRNSNSLVIDPIANQVQTNGGASFSEQTTPTGAEAACITGADVLCPPSTDSEPMQMDTGLGLLDLSCPYAKERRQQAKGEEPDITKCPFLMSLGDDIGTEASLSSLNPTGTEASLSSLNPTGTEASLSSLNPSGNEASLSSLNPIGMEATISSLKAGAKETQASNPIAGPSQSVHFAKTSQVSNASRADTAQYPAQLVGPDLTSRSGYFNSGKPMYSQPSCISTGIDENKFDGTCFKHPGKGTDVSGYQGNRDEYRITAPQSRGKDFNCEPQDNTANLRTFPENYGQFRFPLEKACSVSSQCTTVTVEGGFTPRNPQILGGKPSSFGQPLLGVENPRKRGPFSCLQAECQDADDVQMMSAGYMEPGRNPGIPQNGFSYSYDDSGSGDSQAVADSGPPKMAHNAMQPDFRGREPLRFGHDGTFEGRQKSCSFPFQAVYDSTSDDDKVMTSGLEVIPSALISPSSSYGSPNASLGVKGSGSGSSNSQLISSLKVNRERDYVCLVTECGYSNKCLDYMQSHLYRKHGLGNPDHACDECGKNFFSTSQVRGHKKRAHSKQAIPAHSAPVTCKDCSQVFVNPQKLQTHLLKAHSKGRLFTCEECDFRSPRKKDVQAHMVSQHGKVPPGVQVYTCTQCDYRCTDKNRAEEHQAMHTGQPKYVCTTCSKSYTTRRGMRTHLQYHSTERPHRCDHCQSSFKVRSKLRDHVRLVHTHVGEKPYECGFCGHKTALRGNCNQHIRKHHPGQPMKVTDHKAGQKRSSKIYDYAGLKGDGIDECKDVRKHRWAVATTTPGDGNGN